MTVRILLANGEILEIEDANSILQMNRRCFKREGKVSEGEKAVKVPYQIAILCDPGNLNGKDFMYEDVLKIELLFPPSEYAHLLRRK